MSHSKNLPTISVAMIVKNEQALLGRALKSVRDADEIIVCDTGSTDGTVAIARQFTKKVYTDYKWQDHFADARNHSLSKCTKEWILILDADEYMSAGAIAEIKKRLTNPFFTCVSLKCKPEGGKGYHYMPRLFKNGLGYHYRGAAHNYLNKLPDKQWDVTLTYGYSPAHNQDPDRTLRILLKDVQANPDRSREKYYLAREYWYRKDYKNAIKWWELYLQKSIFEPERNDAYLMLARCYHAVGNLGMAKALCWQAIEANVEFSEAILFLGELYGGSLKKRFEAFAQGATNRNVLFVRA